MTIISQEIHASIDDMNLICSHLDRHTLVINRIFSPKSEPFIIGKYSVPVEESKCEAKHYAVMIDSSHLIYCTTSSIGKNNNKHL